MTYPIFAVTCIKARTGYVYYTSNIFTITILFSNQ